MLEDSLQFNGNAYDWNEDRLMKQKIDDVISGRLTMHVHLPLHRTLFPVRTT